MHEWGYIVNVRCYFIMFINSHIIICFIILSFIIIGNINYAYIKFHSSVSVISV